jgi:cell division control protein 7
MQEFDELTQSEDDQATEEIGEEDVEPQESEMSDDSEASRENHKTITPAVQEEMVKFEESFQGFTKRYKLIDKIGEGMWRFSKPHASAIKLTRGAAGTFSTVYKAEDLLYDVYVNEWDDNAKDSPWVSPASKKYPYSEHPRRPRYVAVKKIYVTSSPMRIQNELELLYDLKYSESVCPLLTAFRYQDQVVAVLPYYRHQDFRVCLRFLIYLQCLTAYRNSFAQWWQRT